MNAVALIEGAGGVCALAHPGMWGDQSAVPVELIERMAAAGMRGLEVDHPDHTPEMRERYRTVAGELDLIATGPEAVRWLQIAQAFAGPPGQGR